MDNLALWAVALVGWAAALFLGWHLYRARQALQAGGEIDARLAQLAEREAAINQAMEEAARAQAMFEEAMPQVRAALQRQEELDEEREQDEQEIALAIDSLESLLAELRARAQQLAEQSKGRGLNAGTVERVKKTHKMLGDNKTWRQIRETPGTTTYDTYMEHCWRVTGEDPIRRREE